MIFFVQPTVTALGEGIEIVGIPSVGPGEVFGFDLSFFVSELDPASLISDIAVAVDGETEGAGDASIQARLFSGAMPLFGCGHACVNAALNDPFADAIDVADIEFGPVEGGVGQVLMFILVSGIPDGSASLRTASFFVSQTRVPEPSVLLLAAGAGALARGVRGRS